MTLLTLGHSGTMSMPSSRYPFSSRVFNDILQNPLSNPSKIHCRFASLDVLAFSSRNVCVWPTQATRLYVFWVLLRLTVEWQFASLRDSRSSHWSHWSDRHWRVPATLDVWNDWTCWECSPRRAVVDITASSSTSARIVVDIVFYPLGSLWSQFQSHSSKRRGWSRQKHTHPFGDLVDQTWFAAKSSTTLLSSFLLLSSTSWYLPLGIASFTSSCFQCFLGTVTGCSTGSSQGHGFSTSHQGRYQGSQG